MSILGTTWLVLLVQCCAQFGAQHRGGQKVKFWICMPCCKVSSGLHILQHCAKQWFYKHRLSKESRVRRCNFVTPCNVVKTSVSGHYFLRTLYDQLEFDLKLFPFSLVWSGLNQAWQVCAVFTGLSSIGSMHVSSEVPSPPRCGRKIPNGRKQVADIRQGNEIVFSYIQFYTNIILVHDLCPG